MRKPEEIVYLNGKFLPVKEAMVSALDPGFLSGCGVFETLRSYDNKIIYFDEHLKRLESSCSLSGISFQFSLEKLKKAVCEVVKRNGFKDSYVRLTLWKGNFGTGILVFSKKYNLSPRQKYQEGFRVIVSRAEGNASFPFSQIKSTSRLLYELAYQKARQEGFDEALLINNLGIVSETSRANIFIVENNEMFTPSLECGCLNGVTRRVVFDLAKKLKLKIYESKFTLQDTYEANEAFLTNSLMGIMPVHSVGKNKIGKGAKHFALTRILTEEYKLLLTK